MAGSGTRGARLTANLGVALSVTCLAFFAWRADWHSVTAVIAQADVGYAALAVLAVLATLVIRALRWRLLLLFL